MALVCIIQSKLSEQTALFKCLLTATLTKFHLNSPLTHDIIPVSDQLQLQTPFLLPEDVHLQEL